MQQKPIFEVSSSPHTLKASFQQGEMLEFQCTYFELEPGSSIVKL